MQRLAIILGWSVVLAAVLLGSTVFAQSGASGSLEQRVERLERILDNRTLVQLLDEVELLRREIQELRGQVELQSHTLSQLKDRQRDLYLDIDRRLQRAEAARSRPATAEAGAQGAQESVQGASGSQESVQGAAAETTEAQTTVAAVAPEPQAADIDPVAEQRAYQQAFNLLKAGRYGEAVKAFDAFLSEYPTGKYADNAQYWLGEAYYVTRQFEPALAEFRKLVSEHPSSQKVSHGLLKIGYIHDELGQSDEARRVLSDLIERYPDSTAARLARERLQRIRGQTG
ncbi:MAG: tol-pal system protein YbgF [Gammaproteobacteria bacterium]|nr:tol-pal system protein YbgF [Gammaproteobacteria bacterium]